MKGKRKIGSILDQQLTLSNGKVLGPHIANADGTSRVTLRVKPNRAMRRMAAKRKEY